MSGAIQVLHVDDDPNLADLAATVLEQEAEELSVETALHPDEGFERLKSNGFDCIISDYEMPDQNGIEFLETVREEYPDLPFILFTGKGSEEVASDAISAGVTDYLQKESGTDQYAVLANRIQNVVDAYQSERKLEERTRRLETLISNLPGIVYRSENEPEWPMETVEGEVTELTGYSADELKSGDVIWGEDILHPEERDRIWDAVQRGLAEDGTFEVTYRIIACDGTVKWMWERGRGVYEENGELEALEGFITDITDKKEWAERLDAYIDNNSDILGVVNESGVFEDLSPSAEDVLGYEPAELEGSPVFEYIHPDDRERIGSEFADLVESGETKRVEYRFKQSDGSWAWLESVASDRTESPLSGYVITTREITDRKRREQELVAQNEKLDAFTSFVSHDLRNALNVATLRLDLAEREHESDHLTAIEQTLDRMEQLIEDLLILAQRGETGGQTDRVRLERIARGAWANLDAPDAELDIDVSGSIQGDESRLTSLVENLFHNAIEHTDGAVTVTLDRLDAGEGFYVADDGPGLSKEAQNRLFETGYSTKDDGTGLGLAIVEQVAIDHGWDVTVTESTDGGARFEVTGVEFFD
ncbi:PAS domain-containing protein [Halovenus sp. HT40]|uniref:PAS domain-containing protein n=1 Tax=Halovenus sp. HT40 TaxID=3126691 RepID=UPI00300E8703